MTAKQEFEKFLAKYDPKIARTAKAALKKLRAIAPNAVELVYDNYNALVIGFSPTERAGHAVFSIALYPEYLNLYFLWGAGLPDPTKRLQGSGKQVRFVRMEKLEVLDEEAVKELIWSAMVRARVAFDPKRKGEMVIRAVAKKQRARKPGKGGKGKPEGCA